MRISMRVLAVLALSMVVAIPACAALLTYSGSLTSGSPQFYRPNANTVPPTSTASAAMVFYHVQPFFVSSAGIYTMEGILPATGYDQFMVLYELAFDPDSPLTNALEANDDSGSGMLSRITRSLTADHQYYFVSTTFSPGQSLPVFFTNQISGDGAITLGETSAIPEPATVSLLGVGLVALLVLVRRST